MSDIWNDFFGDFEGMTRRFEKMFSDLSGMGDGKTYGYTMYQGPDGIPHVREFGNAINEFSPRLQSVRDPFTDVTRQGNEVFVTVELPGVNKEDIVLEGNGTSLKVSVDTEAKKFDKTIALPCEVKEDTARAEYNNGILEIRMDVKDAVPNGRRIQIA